MNNFDFTVSDTIQGYVSYFDRRERSVQLTTSDGRQYKGLLASNAYARIAENLEEPYADATGRLAELLQPGTLVYAHGMFYPEGDNTTFEIKWLVFVGNGPNIYRQDEQDWWIKQIHSIASSYMRWQFDYPNIPIDWRNYRTFLHLAGEKRGDFLQETDTISRLIYGLSSAFMLTGEDSFLEAAEKGTEYLREHMRFYDADEDLIYWYHGIQVSGEQEQKLLTSEFGDDYDSIPAYEQIYALAGPIQCYRASGDPRILYDAEKTIDLFDKYYIDREKGGYFSHIDPITLDPRAEMLGPNRARKNWNSVGDHAPAYLINLYLATGKQEYADFLEYTFDTITEHFQDYDESPFVQEKFHEDWSKDQTWGWQQNRAVVGHNLKIAWNLNRMQSLKWKDSYEQFSKQIADTDAGCRHGRAARRLVRHGRARAATGREIPPHRLARPQGVVADGAGHPRLPDHVRYVRRSRNTSGWRTNRRRSTTPSSSIMVTAASTSIRWRMVCRTCSATSA